jgi:hypothetical protein
VPKSTTIAELRSLVAAWTPALPARSGDYIATGVPAIDAALGGGLPRGRVTELVSGAPSSGGELAFGALLANTRAARLRVALIDAADGFAPHNHRADSLRHLVWVRARSLPEALGCADVLVRDGNYAVLVLDVRGVPARSLRQLPAGVWHRLRLAAEQNPSAVLVQSATGFFPAVPWRLVLRTTAHLDDLRRTRADRVAALVAEVERGHACVREELTG